MVATAAGTRPRRRKTAPDSDGVLTVGRSKGGTIASNAIGIVFAILMIFPVYWVLNTAFKPPNWRSPASSSTAAGRSSW